MEILYRDAPIYLCLLPLLWSIYQEQQRALPLPSSEGEEGGGGDKFFLVWKTKMFRIELSTMDNPIERIIRIFIRKWFR